ncbi:MAG: hypothetical protein J0J05_06955 [Microbacterium sp.]|uniref:hypothetical protein n=1 Tax=Microbacterium sp. TaxID=51671 RepID=UPI001AD3351A|nr:hypothetical protein [Microbacterium sp.]MBN9153703.1 hypothetical protein [Microbacterium sp.]
MMIRFPFTKRTFVSSYLIWRMEETPFAHDRNIRAQGVGESTAWEAIYHAAQEEPYFHAHEQSAYGDASADQVDEVRALLAKDGTSRWWSTPMDRGHQRRVIFRRDETGRAPGDPSPDLRKWMHKTCTGGAEGEWWTMPIGADILTTSRSMTTAPAVALVGNEDEFGDKEALVFEAPRIGEDVRVYEVASVADWVALVDGTPAEVTRSRRTTWGRFDETARWFIPDWAELARSYDAIHLTVDAYLDLSAYPVPCAGGYTLLAGWGPDQSLWLTQPHIEWADPRVAVRFGQARWEYLTEGAPSDGSRVSIL